MILDTEVAQILSDRLQRYGFKLRKELWSSNLAGMGVFLGKCALKFHKNITADITIIAAWELEGLDQAKIVKKMRRIRLKRVTVRLKKITIFPLFSQIQT